MYFNAATPAFREAAITNHRQQLKRIMDGEYNY
jgi:hypothetical protein